MYEWFGGGVDDQGIAGERMFGQGIDIHVGI